MTASPSGVNRIPADSSGQSTYPEAPELTVRVIVLGMVLSVVMGAANVYVGLKAGMTVSASIPAAVMAMMVFRWLFRSSSIREANQVQTCASAGESLAAGVIFTMPALILIGYWDRFDFWTVTTIAATGGLLGILMMIPMRRVFIVNNKDLPYPEGMACAAVLRAGEKSEAQNRGEAASLVAGGLLGALFIIAEKMLGLLQAKLQVATIAGSRVWYFGGDLSPMLIAVGFIVRLNVAILVFIGGVIGWLIAIPALGGGEQFDDGVTAAMTIWSTQVRYIGVGAMVVGGISSLITVRHGLVAAVRELSAGIRRTQSADSDPLQRDLPPLAIAVLGAACLAMLAYVNYRFTSSVSIAALSTGLMAVLGFFFCAVASHIVGLVGNSNSPVSGMTITAVLTAGGLLWLCGFAGMDAMVATLGVAAVVCCVACTSGDLCNDLKTGLLVGSAPYRQQISQIIGVLIAAGVMAPVLNLLHSQSVGGIGGPELSAPQASLFKSLVMGFAGETQLPWHLIGIGAAIGGVILLIDHQLKVRQTGFRAYLMPIAVGMYLPFGLATPMLIGGLIAYWYSRKTPADQVDQRLHRGVLFSSGVIAGEALTAVLLAGLAAMQWLGWQLPISDTARLSLSIAAALIAIATFVRMAKPQRHSEIQ